MANIKSQIKRNRQNTKQRLRNRTVRGTARASLYQARSAMEKNAPESKEAVINAISEIDQAAGKGVIHKNSAARLKSRLMKRLAAMDGTAAPKTSEK